MQKTKEYFIKIIEQYCGDYRFLSLFFASFSLGLFIIFISDFGPVVVLVLACVIMFVYTFFGMKFIHSTSDIPNKQFADSIYYLGFLFTLTALSSALLTMSGLSNEEDISNKIPKLIELSGFALFTTIAGMLLRILVYQFLKDSPALLGEVETQASRAATALEKLAENSTSASESLVLTTRNAGEFLKQETETVANEFRAESKENVHAVKQGINEIVEDALNNVEKSGKIIIEGANQAKTDIINASQDAKELFMQGCSQLGEVVQNAKNNGEALIEKVSNAISEKINEALLNISNSTSAAQEIIEEESIRIKEQFIVITEQHTKKISEQLELINSQISRLGEETDLNVTKLSEILNTQVPDYTNEISNSIEETSSKTIDNLHIMSLDVIEALGNIVINIQEKSEAIDNIDITNINSIANEIESLIELMKKLSIDISDFDAKTNNVAENSFSKEKNWFRKLLDRWFG